MFLPFLLNISEHASLIVRGIREEAKAQLDPLKCKWPHSHFTEAFTFELGVRKEDASDLDISGMGISFQAFVSDCST